MRRTAAFLYVYVAVLLLAGERSEAEEESTLPLAGAGSEVFLLAKTSAGSPGDDEGEDLLLEGSAFLSLADDFRDVVPSNPFTASLANGAAGFSLPRLAVATLGGVTDLSHYLLLLSSSPSSASPSFLSSFYNVDWLGGSRADGATSGSSGSAASLGEWSNEVGRNVMISYRGFRPLQPFEMFSRRNSFIRVLIERLLEFLEAVNGFSVGNIKTVYLRNLGMEIFQLPDRDVLGVREFWNLLLGFPDYVDGIYEDEEMNGFDEMAGEEDVGILSETAVSLEGSDRLLYEEVKSSEVVDERLDRKTGYSRGGGRKPVVEESRRLLPGMPNDPYFATQWAHVDSGSSRWGIETPQAWKHWNGGDSTSSKIVVALIDSGVDYTHPDLRDNIWVNRDEICNNGIDDDHNGLTDDCYGWDFFNGDNDPSDDNGHGTASAGIIAGVANNGVGITGICWGGCELMVLKTLNHQIKGTVIGFVRAIDYAIGQGAKISNNSYGGRGSSFSGLEEAVKRAREAGMIFVAAAGNYKGNNDNDSNPVFPASYKLDNVISVAAITRNGELADFSSFGRTSVDLAAPGQDIFSTTIGGAYKAVDGTSFAVPFVTGAAALLWTREPHLSYTTIIRRIKTYTKYDPKLNGKLRSSGVLDVYAAMTEGGRLVSLPKPISSSSSSGDDGLSSTLGGRGETTGENANRKCDENEKLCGDNAECTDDETSGPVCKCRRGFQRNRNACDDINECLYEPCGPAAICNNFVGSFECVCRDGFKQVGDTCQDIDECASNPCPPQAKCLNFVGNFDCVCPPSYAWNALSAPNAKCLSIRSPTSGPCVRNGDCSINSLCQSTGTWWFPDKKCNCLSGYVLHPIMKECARAGILQQQYPHYLAKLLSTLDGFSAAEGERTTERSTTGTNSSSAVVTVT